MDTNETSGPGESARRSRRNSGIVAAGVAFGLTLAGLGVAAAQTDSSTDTSTTTAAAQSTEDNSASTTSPSAESGSANTPAAPAAPDADAQVRRSRPDRPQETELTGDVAEKVKAAALAAVPGGTIIRVETDADGSPYEAHVRKADGTEVVVKVNESFEVTATEEGHMGGHHGPGGPGHGGPRPGETALTGETADKVTAAAQAAVPGGTVLRVETDADGATYEAHVRNADGTEVEVKLDESFKVTSVEEHEMREPRPPAPGTQTD